jgi:uncharacterized membrane protein YdjX (TVP38/TMEM64 family)
MENVNESHDNNRESEKFSAKFKRYIKNLFDFSKYSLKTIIFIIIIIVLVILSILLLWYIYFGGGQTFLLELIVNWFINPIAMLGFVGILLFIGIMALQGLLIPIPSEIILLATGMIWGIWLGGVMGVIGSMAAASLCYYVSRKGGRPLAEKLVGQRALALADKFIHKYGLWAIIIARLLPFVAFDPISYAAGVIDLDWKKYLIGSFIGSIPRAFFYYFLGYILTPGITFPIDLSSLPLDQVEALSVWFNNVLLIVVGVMILMFIAYYLTSRYILPRIQDRETIQD